MEIERKWLFTNVADPAAHGAKLLSMYTYAQSYISVDPEVRISEKYHPGMRQAKYALTIKSSGTLSRSEIQKPLNMQEYSELIALANLTNEKDFITKRSRVYEIYIPTGQRYVLVLGVIDEWTENEFVYGEIEFRTPEEARLFEAPKWFGQEVTNDKNYYMVNYFNRTRRNAPMLL